MSSPAPFPHALMNEPLALDVQSVEEWGNGRVVPLVLARCYEAAPDVAAVAPSTPVAPSAPSAPHWRSEDQARGRKRSRLDGAPAPRARRLPPESVGVVLEYCGGMALSVFARCGKAAHARATRQAAASLARLTTLRLGHPAVADWRSDVRLLSVFTEPPNLLALFVTENPIGAHAIPRRGLLRTLCRHRTDYARPDHRAFALKCAFRFGDAALVEACLLRMSADEVARNELPPAAALPARARPFYEQWFSSYTDADEFCRRFARCRVLKTAHVRARRRDQPIPLDQCTTLAEAWRDDVDRSVRKRFSSFNDAESDEPPPRYLDGSELVFHFVHLALTCPEARADVLPPVEPRDPKLRAGGARAPKGTTRRFFPGLAHPKRLAAFVQAAAAAERLDHVERLYRLGAPPFWDATGLLGTLHSDADEDDWADGDAFLRFLSRVPEAD